MLMFSFYSLIIYLVLLIWLNLITPCVPGVKKSPSLPNMATAAPRLLPPVSPPCPTSTATLPVLSSQKKKFVLFVSRTYCCLQILNITVGVQILIETISWRFFGLFNFIFTPSDQQHTLLCIVATILSMVCL